MPRRAVPVLPASVLLAAAVLLSGCQAPDTTPTPPPMTPSATPGGSPEPTPSGSPTGGSTPVDVPCDALVTPQAMYDYNPNFSLLSSWTPGSGSAAAEALAADGVACRWQNDTSGEAIDVSIASFDATTLDAKARAAFEASTMVPTYGAEEAYFAVSGGAGEAVVFDRSYWIVVRSVYFLEPGDAEPIVSAVLAGLP